MTGARTRWSALLCAAVLAVGCGGGGTTGAEPTGDDEEPAGSQAEEAGDQQTMPDVVGMPVDDAVAQLEEAGFTVSTGLVRTTEMEPDLVYRTEPAPGRQVQDGQRVTLRVAAEPRE
ncbi:PASTA domain-containing protein [Egicoccus sp. AB-alg2]|uniref:PASTA domain-containing protein n=1 Tax=Egicoccus sp. AB-alg2 TaxID=3242693 RepID=UPI00359ED5C3